MRMVVRNGIKMMACLSVGDVLGVIHADCQAVAYAQCELGKRVAYAIAFQNGSFAVLRGMEQVS